jgi:ATP-dependent helicase Lhr and Lhr-like helicase
MHVADLDEPSPFASSLLFRYVANYLYDGDAPLAERRAQALTVDPAQLRELIGDIDLRGLLDAEVVFDHERRLQRLDTKVDASPDSIHDLLLQLGDLSPGEIRDRAEEAGLDAVIEELLRRRRAVEVSLGGESRLIPVEYASRYRDAIGSPLPAGLPERLLQPTEDPLGDLLLRYARTHGPFTPRAPAARYGLGVRTVEQILQRLVREARLIKGELTPAAGGIEFCHRDVLATLRHRSLARVRREVEPVEPVALVRFTTGWHRLDHPRAGLNALLDAIEQLQGCPIPASVLETEILGRIVTRFESVCLAGIDPRTPVSALAPARLDEVIELSLNLLARNADGSVARRGSRQTTRYSAPDRRLWVYGRANRPCFRCGTPILRSLQGRNARVTYWCPACQSS